jgi:surface protein
MVVAAIRLRLLERTKPIRFFMLTYFTVRFLTPQLRKETWLCVAAFIFFSTFSLHAQDPFITTWKTTTADETITIPTNGTGYSYSVNWGDGSTDATLYTGNATHQYAVAGTYTVSINGTFPRIYFNNGGDRSKIMTVEQWGDIHWTAMDRAFYGCNNLTIPAADAPDLSAVTSAFRMFYQASSFNQPIGHWNVSTIISMNSMFFATPFNQDLSTWDVSNVTDMLNMFSSTPFNQNIGNWNVSNVTNMGGMFASNGAFNQDISNWNVSKVTTMSSMFANAFAFNQDISTWNTANVTNMSFMFFQNNGFNQNLGAWNITKVTNMASMLFFSGLSVKNYTATLNGWAAQPGISSTISLGASSRKYCDQDGTGHADLIARGWTISDAGIKCPVPPTLQTITDKSINEKTELTFTATATAGELSFTFKLDAQSLQKGMSLNSTTGAFSWTPGKDRIGTHEVTILADDGEYGDLEVFTITVLNVNDAPILSSIGNQVVDEDQEATFTVVASDEDSDPITYRLDATSLAKGMTMNASTGVFAWTPDDIHIGTHAVTVTASDGTLNDTEVISITVNAVNDAPILALIGDLSANEDEEITFIVAASDEESDPITYSLDATSLAKGMTMNASTGVFAWTPDVSQIGTHSVTFTASDGALNDTEVISITVNAVNDAPVLLTNTGLSVSQGESKSILTTNLSVTDEDNTPDQLEYTITFAPIEGKLKKGVSELLVGSTFTQADVDAGLLLYDHDGFNGAIDQFTFTVTDGAGGAIGATNFAIAIDIVTALEPSAFIRTLSVYPNPASESAIITLTNSYRGELQFRLMDLAGRNLQIQSAVKNEELIEQTIDLSSAPVGMLMLMIQAGKVVSTAKIVKK